MNSAMVRHASATLLDPARSGEWAAAEAVLRQAGPAAYGPLVEVIAVGDGESVARAGALLGFDEVTDDVRQAAANLRSPSPDIRFDAAYSLSYQHAEPLLPWARVLTTRLADPIPKVSRMAVAVLVGFGREVLPLLREVRRSSSPARRGALTAIAEFGWDEIDPADRRALARLVAVKQAVEVPEPVVFDRQWYAVRTSDRDAVLEAFGLSDPVPVTMRAGFVVGRHDLLHQWDRMAADYHHRECGQMFVSPVLDGWTLVVGTPVSDDELAEHRREPSNDEDEIDEDEHGARQRRCVELSRRLESTVYWYGAEIGEDWTAWCLAENGTLFRYFYDDFRMHEPAVEVGEPLFAEGGLHPPTAPGIGDLLREHAPPEVVEYFIVSEPDIDLYLGSGDDDEYRKDKEAWFDEVQAWLTQAGVEIPQIRHALVIARRTSVDLSELGPGTGVAGSGVLALNACGRVERRRGAFPL